MAEDLEVNDPVFVTRESRQLEGVVCFLGQVSFAEGDDWVGIRLVGTFQGSGKNDGAVQSIRYFECPPNCGIFVKKSAVTKRTLTRLEELRLRRELAQSGTTTTTSSSTGSLSSAGSGVGGPPETPSRLPTTAGSGTTPARTPRTPATTGTTGLATPSAGTRTRTPTTASSSSVSRLEEIRKRREALQGKTTTSTTTSASAPPSRNVSTSSSAVAALDSSGTDKNDKDANAAAANAAGEQQQLLKLKQQQQQLEEAQSQLKARESKVEQLEQQLSQAENKNKELAEQHAADLELQQAANEANANKLASSSPESTTTTTTPNVESTTPSSDNTTTDTDTTDLEPLRLEIQQLKDQLATSQTEFEQQKTLYQEQGVQLLQFQTEAQELQYQLTDLANQAEVRGASDASHYKERARLQAEVAILNRKSEQLELEKQELENSVEELALDKEQLQEEKEDLEDRFEELKLDAETAQMEVDELRLELEENSYGEAAVDMAETTTEASGGGDAIASSNAEDQARSLSVQNARLREALIRLREQSSVNQMELSRQLRTVEKELEESKALAMEVESTRELKKHLEEQISDLKDMVEQGSAYEVMVEDLSDRVLSMEEELMASQAMIREMEEAAEITAEMEEVQSDELKALSRDMEDRESIIRNLEEAIKMQRKREEEFQRTVGNYRNMVETLKQEKTALLELQQGGEGEKSDLVSASQKALARAAQLVQDAAEMRKREAQAAIDRIDSQVRMHLCERFERMLPPSVAASEIASIKGELLLSKVVGKASLSLDGIARSFTKTIRSRAWEWRSDRGESKEAEPLDTVLSLSDEEQQVAATMIHQSEVAHVAIDVSGDLLWLLSAGQWPDILTPEASSELGAIMGHALSDLDVVLGNVLNTLKEEGVLSPHQSNIGAFRQTVVATMQTLRSHIEVDGESLVPMDWKPPALRLFRDASRAKYSSLGCYAAVASVLNHGDSIKTPEATAKTIVLTEALKPLLKKLDLAAAEASKSCLRLAQLDVEDQATVMDISSIADAWRAASDDLLGNVYNMLLSNEGLTPGLLGACDASTDEVIRMVSQFASALRSANLHLTEDNKFHPFSPEVADVWEGVTVLARSIRAADGDEDDINYLLRAHSIENALEEAVEKEPKLALSNAKVASLEKSLALRSKEIAMQNARLSELEKLLAKTSAQPSPRIKSAEMTSSEEMNNLKEEIRVLTEAMDVLHRQVEEYENEIRFHKDAKSPQAKRTSRTPRRGYDRGYSDIGDRSRSGDDLQALASSTGVGAFEAALFRPALQAARRDAAQWKTKATISSLLELPPLNVPGAPSSSSEEEKTMDDDRNPFLQLSSALSLYRLETASVKVVDISKCTPLKTSRAHLHETMRKKASAADRLDQAAAAARQWLEINGANNGHTVSDDDLTDKPLVGRVRFGGSEPVRTLPTAANREDLYRLQLHLVQ